MSQIQLTPFVNFQSRAREAMEFYRKVLGGTLELHTMNGQGQAGPAGPDDRISYARLEADGVIIAGSDGHPNYPPTVGDNLALSLGGTDKSRLTRIFNQLSEGGTIKMPLAQQPWGGEVGWLADQFGINWSININPA